MKRALKPSLGWHHISVVLLASSGLIPAGRLGLSLVARSAKQVADVTQRPPTRTYSTNFNPAKQRPVAAESSLWRISLNKEDTCSQCLGGKSFIFEVINKRTGKTSEFSIANESAQIDDIYVVNQGRVAIVGRVLPNTSIVNLVDVPNGKIRDGFLCVWPSVSPTYRFVAYVKFYPEHMGYGYWMSNKYLVYDLSASPEENRTRSIRQNLSDIENVGVPVYPEGSTNKPNDNILTDESLTHYMSSDGFFWLDRQDMFAFTDRWKGVQRLILVSLVSGISHPKIRITPLTNLGIVDVAKCKDFSESTFQISQIELAKDKPGYLRLSLSSSNPTCILRPTLDIALTNASLTKRSAS